MDKEKAGSTLTVVTYFLILAETYLIVSWNNTNQIVNVGAGVAAAIIYGFGLRFFCHTPNEKFKKVIEFVFAGVEFLSAYILGIGILNSLVGGIVVSGIVLLGTIQMTRKEKSSKKYKQKQKQANTNAKEVPNEVGEPEQVEA